MLEHLQQSRQIFACLKSEQYILPFVYQLFQIHFPIDSLFHYLSHLNIISSFIIYYFFNNYTFSKIFLFNTLIIIIKKMIWRMNSSSSDLMSYCSWAKKISRDRESIGDPCFGLTLYYREYFVFSYTIGDALRTVRHKLTVQVRLSAFIGSS